MSEKKELKILIIGKIEQFPDALRYAAKKIEESYLSGDLRNEQIESGSFDISQKSEEIDIENTKWIIWSIEHASWWGSGHTGYFEDRKMAGEYSYEEACKIVKGANIGDHDVPNEAMIRIK
jgi:hypothetical protein